MKYGFHSIMSKPALLLLATFLLASLNINAEVKLPRLISNGMVLQRDVPLQLWGWASSGEKVTIKFQDKTYQTKASKKGEWSISLPSQNAGGPYTMQVNNIEISDILIGDVWLCSGQSNMELPIRRTLDLYKDEVKDMNNSKIRMFRVTMKYNFQQEETDFHNGDWKEVNPVNVMDFSALAYFFAKDLYDKYNVPIGLINTAVGGSPVEAWLSKDALKNYPHYLEAAEVCADKEYVDNVRKADSQISGRWHTDLNQADKGLSLWHKDEFDATDWETISLPGYWIDKGVGRVSGALWFRKNFEVSESMAGKAGVLRLGCIVDSDSTFVNGVFVGTITYQYPPRIYNIPEGVLRKGENNVTIRVVSNSGRGGFVEEKPYKVIVENSEIDLTGEWKYKIGAKVQPSPSQTTFQYKPTGLYNALIAPAVNYGVKGFLWYQGESNTGRASEYKQLLTNLINDWRLKWRNPEIPFIYAQLPNFMKVNKAPVESGWAELREAQRQILSLPKTGMAVTLGLGEWNDIHPLNKKGVARLLALESGRVAYNDTETVSSGPLYESMEIKDGSIILTFSSVGSGLYTNLNLEGFAIAGEDKKYVWANAVALSDNTIKVWSANIQNPISVRYAWADNPQGANLKNKEGLLASPFTTDK
jgi:Domain of unknown function (DUF303).